MYSDHLLQATGRCAADGMREPGKMREGASPATEAGCEAAAKFLGLSDVSLPFNPMQSTSYPPGCSFLSGGTLIFNHDLCDTPYRCASCSSSDRCLCAGEDAAAALDAGTPCNGDRVGRVSQVVGASLVLVGGAFAALFTCAVFKLCCFGRSGGGGATAAAGIQMQTPNPLSPAPPLGQQPVTGAVVAPKFNEQTGKPL